MSWPTPYLAGTTRDESENCPPFFAEPRSALSHHVCVPGGALFLRPDSRLAPHWEIMGVLFVILVSAGFENGGLVLALWNLAFMTCVMCVRVLVSVVTLFHQLLVDHEFVITALQRFSVNAVASCSTFWEYLNLDSHAALPSDCRSRKPSLIAWLLQGQTPKIQDGSTEGTLPWWWSPDVAGRRGSGQRHVRDWEFE